MVYVDNTNAAYRRMIMCHMIADDHMELLIMADQIGVNRKWIQDEGTYNEHFDVSKSAKAKAIKLGAVQVTMMQLGRILLKRPGHPLYKPEQANDAEQ